MQCRYLLPSSVRGTVLCRRVYQLSKYRRKGTIAFVICEQQMANALGTIDWEGRFCSTQILLSFFIFFDIFIYWTLRDFATSNIGTCFDICHCSINSFLIVYYNIIWSYCYSFLIKFVENETLLASKVVFEIFPFRYVKLRMKRRKNIMQKMLMFIYTITIYILLLRGRFLK